MNAVVLMSICLSWMMELFMTMHVVVGHPPVPSLSWNVRDKKLGAMMHSPLNPDSPGDELEYDRELC